jgi:hypothetical protein
MGEQTTFQPAARTKRDYSTPVFKYYSQYNDNNERI